GYNAGPNAAARWMPTTTLDPDIWVENIPYNETRAYVQRILWHTVVFKWLETGKPQETHVWLAAIEPIGGRDAAASARLGLYAVGRGSSARCAPLWPRPRGPSPEPHAPSPRPEVGRSDLRVQTAVASAIGGAAAGTCSGPSNSRSASIAACVVPTTQCAPASFSRSIERVPSPSDSVGRNTTIFVSGACARILRQ